MASYTLGWAKCVQGDLPGALQDFQEGRRNSLVAGNSILAHIITLDIGTTYILQGHLHRAAETLREAIQFKYDKSEIKTPFAGKALVILADILREWNDLDTAKIYIEEQMIDELFEIVSSSNSIHAIIKYTNHLKSKYPDELLEYYKAAIEIQAEQTGRSVYVSIVQYLKQMAKLKGGLFAAKALKVSLLDKYKNRRAMKEEFGKLNWD